MDRLLHIMQCGEKKAIRIIVSTSNRNEGHRVRGIINKTFIVEDTMSVTTAEISVKKKHVLQEKKIDFSKSLNDFQLTISTKSF